MGAHSTQVSTAVASTEIAGGGLAWTNPQYASVEDGTDFAQASFAGFELTEWINALTFATWPAFNARFTITGLGCIVNAQCDVADACFITHCMLTTSGVQYAGTSDLSNPKPIENSFKYIEVGGDGEMWGLSDSGMKAFIQAKFQGFRFEVEEVLGGGANVDVDGMYMIVYYNIRPPLLSLLGAGI